MVNDYIARLNALIHCVDEPSKVVVLSELSLLGESTAPELGRGVLDETGGEYSLSPQTVRHILKKNFDSAGIVHSVGAGHRYDPILWSISDDFYGKLGNNALEVMSQTNRPITDFFGRHTTRDVRSISTPSPRTALLSLANSGDLDGVSMRNWDEDLQLNTSVYYDAAKLGLIHLTKGNYLVSDEAKFFLETVYEPLRQFVLGSIETFPQLDTLVSTKTIGELYVNALRFD